MAVLEIALTPQDSESVQMQARPRRWNVDEYYRMAEVGILGPDERTELIEGEIYTMSPIGVSHSSAVYRVAHALEDVIGPDFYVHTQSPIRLTNASEPEPDVYVAIGNADLYDYHRAEPTDLVLVVEVSDSTLKFDKMHKGRVYAEAGIPEYWIVNLVDRRLEVYRDPISGEGYSTISEYAESDLVDPLGMKNAKIPVATLLPKPRTTTNASSLNV